MRLGCAGFVTGTPLTQISAYQVHLFKVIWKSSDNKVIFELGAATAVGGVATKTKGFTSDKGCCNMGAAGNLQNGPDCVIIPGAVKVILFPSIQFFHQCQYYYVF